jgi:hypothetical protein
MRNRLIICLATAALIVGLATFPAAAPPIPKPPTTTSPTTTTSAPPPSVWIGWAVVDVNGNLVRGSGAVSAENVGTDGVYFVRFNRDVRNCAYVGAGGEPGNFPPDDAITIGASASDRGNPNEVSIIEYDAILGADSYSSGFHLIVTC